MFKRKQKVFIHDIVYDPSTKNESASNAPKLSYPNSQ